MEEMFNNFKSFFKKNKELFVVGICIIVTVISSLVYYSYNRNSHTEDDLQMSSKDDINSNTQSASTEIGKKAGEDNTNIANNIVNNVVNATTTNTASKSTNQAKKTTGTVSKNVTNNATNNTTNTANNATDNTAQNATTSNNSASTTTSTDKENETISFIMPVKGEVTKEFAKDNLVYSDTLEEWVTHLGIDIKADKTTVVKATADGTVKSIKNDPRYGLTVVVSHDNGYESVYSNLLTSEFVVEGEKISQGQSIGTVGNSAVFEIADDSHLHFELLKDSNYVDPTVLIKEK